MKSPDETRTASTLANVLFWFERIITFALGLLLFVAAIALLIRATGIGLELFQHPFGDEFILDAAHFLETVLVTLMFLELGYTMILSVRGQVLLVEPFLIVGIIAVVRRILALTIEEKTRSETPSLFGIPAGSLELLVLAVVAIVLVFAIHLWRRQKPQLPGYRESVSSHSGTV
ncbi:MAG: hypothetical protein JO359_10255 [Candidatus Eremiobacteraeota bacterium]|nr:hypothetical protein [Candidatus Eremiobacteraeota bacterium]